jgi:hypothetical protein
VGGPAEDRSELERRLREEMQAAARTYHQAVAEHQTMISLYTEFHDNPDGALAARMAAARERLALEKYARAVKLYADLVVRGQRP